MPVGQRDVDVAILEGVVDTLHQLQLDQQLDLIGSHGFHLVVAANRKGHRACRSVVANAEPLQTRCEAHFA
jgi:hypothetical protein